MIHAFTGHRPPTIWEENPYSIENHLLLVSFACHILRKHNVEEAISGMALGWDQAVADACILLGIPFIAAIPFKNHGNNWPKASRDHHAELLKSAKKVETCKGYIHRDHWMVDHGQKLIALDKGLPESGTGQTVEYARVKIGAENIIHVWQDWLEFNNVR